MGKKVFRKPTRSNLFYIVILVIVIIILSIVSLGIKFTRLLAQSSFTTPSFNVLVTDQDAHVIHVDRANHAVSMFTIKGAGPEMSKLTNLGASLTFRVPIDARIEYRPNVVTTQQNFFSLKRVLGSLFNTVHAKYTGMNSSDVMKMYLAVQNVNKENRHEITRSKSYLADPNKNIDDQLFEIFRDDTIINETVSIEIVNATDISGFGSRIAKVLENAGYNVISVKNGENSHSAIVDRTDHPTQTSQYLQRLLKFPVTDDHSTPVADISIIFGK